MTQGYKLVEGWSLTKTQENSSGTKTYLSGVTLPGVDLEDIPILGESWGDGEDTLLTAKSIVQTYIGDCATGLKHTISYDTDANAGGIETLDKLLKSASVGSEVQAWEPKNNSWVWDSDGTAVAQPIFKVTTQTTINVERYVTNYDDFMNTCMITAGKVNSGTYLGCLAGSLLFIGADMQEYTGVGGVRRWKAILHFVSRNIEGENDYEGAWQKAIRLDNGKWDVPTTATGDKLYAEDDFASLIT